MIEEVDSWVAWVHAFGWAALVWAVVMALRLPFVIRAEEAAKGSWFSGRFIYHRPELVATLRCKATGQPQLHRFKFEDAEPNAFVDYSIEVEGGPPKHLYTATVVGNPRSTPHMIEPGRGARSGGTRIGPNREASLLIVMRRDMVSQTVRVFMRDFSIGNPEDQDGDEGEFREAFRRAPEGNDGP